MSSLEELAQAVVPAGLPRLDAPEHTEPSSASGGLSQKNGICSLTL
ncbi:MAG: Glycine dehydrogenase, partial [Actinomyces urogenitalis DORA_12]